MSSAIKILALLMVLVALAQAKPRKDYRAYPDFDDKSVILEDDKRCDPDKRDSVCKDVCGMLDIGTENGECPGKEVCCVDLFGR
uniref:Toxin CjTL8 n=1 Tax=Epiactis japonica TaxID=58804 RepID=CJTL8_EPIJA|nr:RecName: Full=Toxin CjTL8; Flags: Precursor [Epiactis japonica]